MRTWKKSLFSDLSWVTPDRSSGHCACSCLTSYPLPAWWLAFTVSCSLRPWPTLESGLRSQERPFQLPCAELALCPTGQMPPRSLLLPSIRGWGGPRVQKRRPRTREVQRYLAPASGHPGHPQPQVSASYHTPPSALICGIGSKRAHNGTARGQGI